MGVIDVKPSSIQQIARGLNDLQQQESTSSPQDSGTSQPRGLQAASGVPIRMVSASASVIPPTPEIVQATAATEVMAGTMEASQDKQSPDQKKEVDHWKGMVSIMGGFKTGNKDSIDFAGKSQATYTNETNEATLKADAAYGTVDDELETMEVHGGANSRVYFSDNGYLVGDILMEHDQLEDVDLRVDSTLGAGYRWFDTERTRLLTDLGVGINYELYDEIGGEIEPSLRLGLEYTQKFFEQSAFTQNIIMYPSMGTIGEFRLLADTAFLTPLNDSLAWTLNLINEYDSAPPVTKIENHDISLRTGLQYNF